MEFTRLRKILLGFGLLPVLLFSIAGFLTMGYHPGVEDDAVYLAAVKAAVNPTLYPHDAAFFEMQMRTSVFDSWMAYFIRATGISIATAELAWQFLSLFLMIWACWLILRCLFEEQAARWGGIAMLAAMLTLPVAGTALYLADQYLHPRNPATALILLAVTRILAGRRWQAVPLLLLSFVLHPLMGAMGASFCCVLTLTLSEPVRAHVLSWRARFVPRSAQEATPVAALVPFAWLFDKPTPAYLDAMRTRHCYMLFQWTWYEWLGAIGPLVIFWLAARLARKQGNQKLARFATAVFLYGTFQQIVAIAILGPRQLEAFATLEPMRYLQLIYVFLTLIGGAYLGRYLLKTSAWRWAAFLLLANGGMCYAQRQLFPATEHIELPGAAPVNPWAQAFEWVRMNTPQNAYFAIDPYYMSAPGNDNHSFRALAERSVLADTIKDTAVVTKSPEIGAEWARQVHATSGWSHFQRADFERLKLEFGVDWALVTHEQAGQLNCLWHNDTLSICRIP
jgi:hypothetical protein